MLPSLVLKSLSNMPVWTHGVAGKCAAYADDHNMLKSAGVDLGGMLWATGAEAGRWSLLGAFCICCLTPPQTPLSGLCTGLGPCGPGHVQHMRRWQDMAYWEGLALSCHAHDPQRAPGCRASRHVDFGQCWEKFVCDMQPDDARIRDLPLCSRMPTETRCLRVAPTHGSIVNRSIICCFSSTWLQAPLAWLLRSSIP